LRYVLGIRVACSDVDTRTQEGDLTKHSLREDKERGLKGKGINMRGRSENGGRGTGE
jgi:hypothetical protein